MWTGRFYLPHPIQGTPWVRYNNCLAFAGGMRFPWLAFIRIVAPNQASSASLSTHRLHPCKRTLLSLARDGRRLTFPKAANHPSLMTPLTFTGTYQRLCLWTMPIRTGTSWYTQLVDSFVNGDNVADSRSLEPSPAVDTSPQSTDVDLLELLRRHRCRVVKRILKGCAFECMTLISY